MNAVYIAAVTLLLGVATAAPPATVVQVHAIFRHGERTPADTYPLDPHINETFYPVGWGQLTLNGKRQQLEQGRFLRGRYSALLGDVYGPDSAYTFSTDVDRSLMSASLVLAGLFPPNPDQQLEEGLNWQPVPVHTTPLKHDDTLLVRLPCSHYYEERKKALAGPPNTELLERNAELLQQLTEITGHPINTLDDVQSLYSTLLAEERFNLTLPEWTKGIYPERLINMTSYSFIVNLQNDVMKRLKAGPLLQQILERMQARTRDEPSKRILLYSGHDSTVANLLSALDNLHPPYIPGYNALVVLELLQTSPENFAVRIYRRTQEHPEPEILHLQGCAEECPLEDFVRLTAHVRPQDWKTECHAQDPNFVPPPPPPP